AGPSPAAAAAPPAAEAAPGTEGGRPLVRKKDSNMPSKMQKNCKEQATCLMQPLEEKKEEKKDPRDKDGIYDPDRDQRTVVGRDPESMTDEQMKNLRGFIAQYEAVGVKGLLDEFESIKTYNIVPFQITAHEVNPTKNRYKDIFCIDATRIKLNDGKPGDYIHANLVSGVNDFVTTQVRRSKIKDQRWNWQGPIEGTVNDFWRLVVQQNVGFIFMLCSIIELGKKKCEVYYPETLKEPVTYQDIVVTLIERHEDAHFINSKMIIEAPGKPKRYIYHHYWKNWPDRGVPITALAGLRLLRHARMSNYTSIVHCSAGVGRTGTLVAIEWLLQNICLKPPPYDMKEMLKFMRNHRAHAIQTAPQYAYIAFAIFRLMAIKDFSTIPQFMKFSTDMQTYTG
ncbi:hypothetical protein PMAYCL1PPCAC_17964, partial [Pristionchus mayeri]